MNVVRISNAYNIWYAVGLRIDDNKIRVFQENACDRAAVLEGTVTRDERLQETKNE